MFKKLKDLFIVSDDEFKKEVSGGQPSAPEQTTQKENQTPSVNVDLSKPSTISDPEDSKFLNILFSAIEKNNMDGFDYLEFKTSLQNLKDLSMDEATKYSSAIAMAKTMGASSESISASANHYLSVLKAEEEKFENALNSQQKKLEEDKTSGLKKMKEIIANKERKIKELQAEIEADNKKLSLKDAEIKASAEKIHQTNIHFHHAYSIIVDQIVNDVNNINKYTS